MLLQDVRGFSTKLAALTNEQLKQVAEIHQNDPYIFSMAVDESNRRKAAKVAEASRGEPKQTVVETELADMSKSEPRLPEDMGIGALPERSLSNMADGGIVGYADTGLVQPGKTPAQRMLQGMGQSIDAANEAAELKNKLSQRYGTASALPGMFTEQSDAERENAKAIMGRLNSMSPTEMRFVLETGALPQGSSSFQPYDRNRKGNAPSNANAPPATPPVAGGGAEDLNAPSGVPVARPVARPAAPPAVRPTAGAPTGAPPAAATGIQTLLTSPDLTPEAIADARKKFTDKQPAVVDTLKDQRQALVDEKNKNAAAEYTSFKERMAKQGDPYAKQEERANKQEASVAESAERNPYLALMEAGFAMMSGDSPYAMVNLGKGALAGTKTYRDGLALIEKAKEKLTETRDRIDGLRLIRSDLNDKEERDIQRETRRTALEGKTIMFNALEKLTGESKAQIESNVQLYLQALEKGKDRSLQAGIAQMQERGAAGRAAASLAMQKEIAAMPGAQEKFYAYLGNGNVKAGFDYFVKETAEGKGDEALMQFVLKTPDILSGISPALRKIIEQRITERFVPAAKNTPTGKVFE